MSDDFTKKGKKIRPIIFSHGLTALNAFYSGLLIDLASQGYLVIAPNHQDGSCLYTSTTEREMIELELKPFYDKEYRRE